jgi:hypothetical protein
MALCGGQRVVIADKDDTGGMQRALNLMRIKNGIVAAIGLVELAQIFSAVMRILGADFALHSFERMQLACAAAGSEIRGRGHDQLLAFGS